MPAAKYMMECGVCGNAFESTSYTAKYCKPYCRVKAKKEGRTEEVQPKVLSGGKSPGKPRAQSEPLTPQATEEPDLDAHPLVVATRKELGAKIDSFSGQLAMQLARKLAGSGDAGVSSLSKELRIVLASALDGVIPPAPTEQEQAAEPDEDDDPVEAARRAREQALSGLVSTP